MAWAYAQQRAAPDWAGINKTLEEDHPEMYTRPQAPQQQQAPAPAPQMQAPAPMAPPPPAPTPQAPAPQAAAPAAASPMAPAAPSGGGTGNALEGLASAIARGQSGPVPGWADDPSLAQTAGELGSRSPGSPMGVLSSVVQKRGRFY